MSWKVARSQVIKLSARYPTCLTWGRSNYLSNFQLSQTLSRRRVMKIGYQSFTVSMRTPWHKISATHSHPMATRSPRAYRGTRSPRHPLRRTSQLWNLWSKTKPFTQERLPMDPRSVIRGPLGTPRLLERMSALSGGACCVTLRSASARNAASSGDE